MRARLGWLFLASLWGVIGCDDGTASAPGEVIALPDAAPDAAPCAEACAAGATQCAAGGVQTCARADGCLVWSEATACPSGMACVDGACEATCDDACAADATRCAMGGVERCTRGMDGCLAWTFAACPADMGCVDGACACEDACPEAGATECFGFDVRTCERGPGGCLRWAAARACPGEQRCDAGVCRGCPRQSACRAGEAECVGDGVRRCGAADAEGCRAWAAVEPCAHDQRCEVGRCVGPVCAPEEHACDDRCVPSDVPATCGDRCRPCPAPARGRAICVEQRCGIECDPGAHACDGQCRADDAPESCGDRCEPCPAPVGGVAVCVDARCAFTCEAGRHRCDDACVEDDAPAHCGDRCAPCPAPEGSEAICVEGRCDVRCLAGFQRIDNRCVPCPMAPDGAPACPGTWSDAETIGRGAAESAEQPQIALTTDGLVMTVWVQGDPDERVLRARWLDPQTGVWSDRETISDFRLDDARTPRLSATLDGGVAVVWAEGAPDNHLVHARLWDPAAREWGPAATLDDSPFDDATAPAILTTALGTTWIAWAEGDPAERRHTLHVRQRPADAPEWGPAVDLQDNRLRHAIDPALAADAMGNVYLAWAETDDDGDSAQLFVRRYDALSAMWSAPESLESFRLDLARGPAMTVNAAGDVWLAWTELDDDDAALFVRRRTVADGVWSEPVELTDFRLDEAREPQLLTAPGGDVLLAWTELDEPGRAGLFVRWRRRDAAEWSEPVELTDFRLDEARTPRLGVDASGRIHLVWSEGEADDFGLHARRYEGAPPAWTEALELTDFRLDNAVEPALVVAPAGQAFLVWSEGDVGDRDIHFRRFWP